MARLYINNFDEELYKTFLELCDFLGKRQKDTAEEAIRDIITKYRKGVMLKFGEEKSNAG